MYKLIVTDVDGTLLDDQSRLPDLNRKALVECHKKGIKIILATGKSVKTITEFIDLFDLRLPQITLNGGVVYKPGEGVIETNTMDRADYLELIGTIKDYGHCPTAALTDGTVVYDCYHPDMIHIQNAQVELNPVENLAHPSIAGRVISAHVPIDENHPLDTFLRKKFSSRLFIVRSGQYFFDFLKKGVSKGNALTRIINQYGFKREEVVAFGDSFNDLSLFKVAGLSVAMKNSYPQVLKAADLVAEGNHHSGLGKAIFRYILSDE